MSIVAIILIILLGIILFVIEFLILPGITIAGIGGFILTGGGIFAAYYYKGPKTGSYILLGTIVFFLFVVYFMLKARTWNRAMLNTQIEGKVENLNTEGKIKVGDYGKTISRLAPMGKVLINDKIVEAKSIGGYINENTEIEVIKVNNTNIIVKPKI